MKIRYVLFLLLALLFCSSQMADAQTNDDLRLGYEELICVSDTAAAERTVTVQNLCLGDTKFVGGVFKIAWGDGAESEFIGAELGHRYANYKSYIMTFFWTSNDGSIHLSKEFTVSLKRAPIAVFSIPSTGSCINAETTLQISEDYKNEYPETEYFFRYGDNIFEHLTQQEVIARAGSVIHTFRNKICDGLIQLTLRNECVSKGYITEESTATLKPITVMAPIEIDFSIEPTPACTGIPFELIIDKSKVSVCNARVEYTWTLQDQGAFQGEISTHRPYEQPGEYDVVLLAKVVNNTCANATKKKKIRVIERAIADFSVPADMLCLTNAPLVFTNNSSGDSITNSSWYVADRLRESANKLQDFSSVFSTVGSHNVRLSVENSCSFDVKDTTIIVKQSPEITRWTLPDTLCPNSPSSLSLDMREYISYAWNGNPINLTWTISDGVFESGSTASSEYPKFNLQEGKAYTISVTLPDVLVNGVGCGDPTKLSVSKTIWVSNSGITASISSSPVAINDTVSICEGATVAFTNSSTGENLKYQWTVTPIGNNAPGAGIEYVVGSETSASPEIKFRGYGDYMVSHNLSARCNDKTLRFHVRVKKDPTINLTDFPPMVCPDEIVNMFDCIDFSWYNNTPRALWTFTPNTLDFLENTDKNSPMPIVHLKESETYTVKVELGTVGCSAGATSTATGTIRVRKSALTSSVTVENGGIVCEGKELKFTNAASDPEGDLRYKWIVDRPENCVFTKSDTAKITKIQFNLWGDYQVTGRVESYCDTLDKALGVLVKKDPKVMLRDTAICPGTLNMEDFASYEWYNNTPKVAWTIKRADGIDQPGDYEFMEGTANSSIFPRLDFKRNGGYIVVADLETVNCQGAFLRAEAHYTVYDTGIYGIITPNQTDICEGDGIVFNNTMDGVGLTWAWSVAGQSDGYIFDNGGTTSTEKVPTITFNKYGEYTVNVAIRGTCNYKERSFKIIVRGAPVIAISNIADVCEPFLFKGKELVQVTHRNDTLYRTKWSITPDGSAQGHEFLPGYSDISAYPEISFRTGKYNIVAQYWGRCPTPGEASFSIAVDEFIPIEKLRDTTVCVLTSPFLLKAKPQEGGWTLKTMGITDPHRVLYQNAGGDYYFSPQFDAYFNGDIELVYSKANGSCMARDTMSVHVNPLPVVSAGLDTSICVNIPFRLMVGAPLGGHWEQNSAILQNDLFLPQVPGDVVLKYYFTDGNTCTNSDSTVMRVHPLPDTRFTTAEKHCRYAEVQFVPLQTDGNRFVWNFGDNTPAVTSTDAGIHHYDIYGDMKVSNITTSKYGCIDKSDTTDIEILNLPPPAFFDVDTLFGCAPFEVDITIDTMQYQDDHNYLAFKWEYGDGVTHDGLRPQSPKFYPSGTWDTTYVTRFTVSNICKTETYDTTITVLSVPRASFKLKHEWECAPVLVEFQNTTTGNRAKLVWDFGDGTTAMEVGNPIHEYTTDSVATKYYITLTATNQCAQDAYKDSLVVKPRTIRAFFSPQKPYACVNEEICFKNHSTDTVLNIGYTHWNFGDGASDTLWNSCHSYSRDGIYTVELEVNNGCGWDTISDRITIYPLPQLSIESGDSFCEDDTVGFVLRTDQQLRRISWDFGDGQTGMKDSLYHVFDGYGTFLVKAEGVSANMGSCVAKTSKDVVIHNKPIIAITPIDTFGCSPLIYSPKLTGEGFFMWDFGDGSAMMSHEEHLYENLSDTVQHYQVRVYVETDWGCKSDYKGVVNVYNVPRARIDKEVTFGKPESVLFINNSEEETDGIWYLPSGEVVHSLVDQRLEFDRNGTYTLAFVAANRYGCKDSITLVHEVLIKGLYFPNTFIPHSSNEKINRFNGIGMGIKEYKLEIYDLYGNKLWETQALEQGYPSEGWDGKDFNGKPLSQGVYVWKAKAIFGDDEIWTGKNPSGAVQTIQGTVMLLRE